MPRFSRPFAVFLLAGAAFGAGFSLRAHGQNDALFDLVTYRTALEQLRGGHPQNAQTLLENSQNDGPLAPENALLLAYLEDAAGQTRQARQTLSGIDAPSPLASAYLRRLGGDAPPAIPQKTGALPENSSRLPENSARLPATDARLTKLEAFMLGLVNDERAKNGLSPLQNDPRLAEIARAHSAEMRDKRYFAHESPTPSLRMPLDRYELGYGGTPRIVAENIYRIYGGRSFVTEKDTRDAHNSFMHSPGHRANLLNRDVTRIGLGFCTDSTGNLWVTQMFSLRD